MKSLLFLCALVCTTVFAVAQSPLEKAKQLYQSHDLEAAATQIQSVLKESANNVEALTLAGDIFRELEQAEKSLQYYKRAYDQSSDNSITARKYASALSAASKDQQAIDIMRKAVKNDKNDVYNQLMLGEVLVNADSLNSAELILTKAREMNRNIPDGFLALGSLYYRQKIFESARDNYEQAIKIDSTNELAIERLATMYFRQANAELDNALASELYNRSLQQWAAVIRLNPKNARAYFEQGKIFFYAQKFSSAAPSLAQYLRLRPDADNSSIAHWYLAQSFARVQACDSAEPHFRYAIEKIDSVKDKAYLLFARCQFDTKKYQQAAESFKAVKALNVKLDADDQERYGYSLMLSGDTTNAIEQIRLAIELNPTKCKTMERLANLCYDRKLYEDAIAMYKKVLNSCQNPQPGKLNALLGRSYFSANKADSAVMYLDAAISGDSSLFFARSLAVRSFVSAQRVEDAIKYFTSAVDYAKREPEKYKADINGMGPSIASALYEKKSYKELVKFTKIWIEFDPKSELGNLYCAVASQGLTDKDGACKYYKEVLKINPANKTAKDNLKALACD